VHASDDDDTHTPVSAKSDNPDDLAETFCNLLDGSFAGYGIEIPEGVSYQDMLRHIASILADRVDRTSEALQEFVINVASNAMRDDFTEGNDVFNATVLDARTVADNLGIPYHAGESVEDDLYDLMPFHQHAAEPSGNDQPLTF
jgi:hypothetical protein